MSEIEVVELTKIEKIKTHFRENKKTYIATSIGVVTTAVTMLLIMNGRDKKIVLGDVDTIIDQSKSFMPRSTYNQFVATFEEKSTPSRPIRMVGADGIEKFFRSISEAHRQTGHSLAAISRVVNGHSPSVGGDFFEALEIIEDTLEDVRG